MKRFRTKIRIRIQQLFGVGAILVGGWLAACAQDLPDIDRTQPRALKKSIFRSKNADGTAREWLYRQTVVEVPYGTGATFVGEQGETYRIVWEITERTLFAYRSHELVADSEKKFQRDATGEFRGAAVAAYRIEKHFDIQRSYNAATGEQTNVIVENSFDRPWQERDYMRVDFSKNLVTNFKFVTSNVKQQSLSYYIPENELENEDRARLSDDYIDLVNKVFIQPETHPQLSAIYGRPIPTCYLYSNVSQDCLGQAIKIRSSFMLRKESGYVAKSYDNRKMDKFGYFRTVRHKFDRHYGVLEDQTQRLINRWGIWKDEAKCVDQKAALSHAKCTVKPVVFHVNKAFPDELKKAAAQVFQQWNERFKEVAKRLSGKSFSTVFAFCPNNPVKKGDSGLCGKPGLSPRIGDLRYNLLFWTSRPHRSSPLGYGPSAADPLTGEIMSANAFIYGGALNTYAQYATDIVRLMNGDLKPEQAQQGQHVQAYLRNLGALKSSTRRSLVAHSHQMGALTKQVHLHDKVDALKKQIQTGQANVDWVAGNLKALREAPGTELVVPGEIFKAFNLQTMSPSGQINEQIRKHIGLTVLADRQMFDWSRQRMKRLASHNIMMADFMDDAVIGLATRIKKELGANGTLDYGKVYKRMREEIFLSVALHEVGHNIGLRHNFAASADALNYHNHYWDLRAKTVPPGKSAPLPQHMYDNNNRELLDNAVKQGMRDYQYSSIMDYGAGFASSLKGLGKYDRAAILYGYGDLVEVFNKSNTALTRQEAKEKLSRMSRHYTQFPRIIGGAAKPLQAQIQAMHAREVVKESTLSKEKALVEVPYAFCSDEYHGGSSDCYRFDQGADPYERVENLASRYMNYHIFDAYKRGRLAFGSNPQAYMSRIYNRYFRPIADQQKHFINDLIHRSKVKCDGVSWDASPACGQSSLIAAIAGLNFFGRVLQTPDVGCYTRTTNKLGNQVFEKTSDGVCESGNEVNAKQIGIPLGMGRKMMSQFAREEHGYEFFWKPLNYGAWWDKYLAVMALGDPYTRFLGVDSTADARSFLINFNNFFGRYVNNMVGGFLAGRSDQYGAYVSSQGRMVQRDQIQMLGDRMNPAPHPRFVQGTIDPNEQYTAKLLVGFLGAVYFSGDTNDQRFNESMKISVRGLSENPEVPDVIRNDTSRYVEIVDPATHRIYYAARVENRSNIFSQGPSFFSVGYEFLSRLKAKYYEADGKRLKPDASKRALSSEFHYINVMMGWLHVGEYNRPR